MIEDIDHQTMRVALAEATSPQDVYAAAAGVLARHFHFIALTFLVLSNDRAWSNRVWSSNRAEYPSPDRRPFVATDEAAECFRHGKPFLANNHAALRANFPHAYEIIRRLGIDFGANVPVVALGRSLGKVTLSADRASFRPGLMDAVAAVTPYLVLPFARDADALSAAA
jgi:hypothetical protein